MKRKLEKIVLVILIIQTMILGNFMFVLNSIVKAVNEENKQNASTEQVEQENMDKQKEENVWLEQRILTNKISKNRKMLLKVEDVLGNVYFYKMTFRYFHGYYIIKYIEEIKNIDKE